MCGLLFQRSLRIERLGVVPYGPMLKAQEQRHEEVLAGESDDTLFLLQHEPVITLGRNGNGEHLRVSETELATRGIDYVTTGRGGDITYHGPGQVVGYAIVHLQPEGERDIKQFVGWLEEIVMRALADFGVAAERKEGMRGIWVGDNKIAAVGVRIARWTSLHGFALNVCTDLKDFDTIVPCGLHGYGVTSLEQLLGDDVPSIEAVQDRLVIHAGIVLDRRTYEDEPLAARVSG